ncbi:hypothetical protein HNQ53_001728 [Microbulbifer hydrolyticus]|uniref:Uncharacterized protein n=1 Tax=Microbulbifer hydrolyticus TaxID=48074 RepID=A0AA89T5P1_9GAMM|nr:hypothetical protein [Microbulbifer hydrolyticus]
MVRVVMVLYTMLNHQLQGYLAINTHNKAFNHRYSRKNTRLPLDSFSATSLL